MSSEQPSSPAEKRTAELIDLDRRYVWHPFTAMRQWRESDPLVIERGEGEFLIDTFGRRYIDGVSSLWCNVHGHCVPAIDQAIRDQLEKIAHTTLLGLASEPSIRLAAELVRRVKPLPRGEGGSAPQGAKPGEGSVAPALPLTKVFYSDAGATALEIAFKMAVGYWFHRGQPQKNSFIALGGAYHGDTTGAMSVGYSDLFHRPFASMVFPVRWAPAPDAVRLPVGLKWNQRTPVSSGPAALFPWPSEDPALAAVLRDHCLHELEALLQQHASTTAAVVIEPVMQGAAGMICQPPGFVAGVARLARQYGVLLIADEVAVGFGRTGKMFACAHDGVTPDLMCLAKGITGGYLPLAATLATDEIEQAFWGAADEHKTFYHGHTYTGNALACAAALASLELFDSTLLMAHIQQSAAIIADRLGALRDHPHICDIRQRGIMVGIELADDPQAHKPFDFSKRTAAAICMAMREKGLILRPLGDVLVLMPIPAMPHASLHRMLDIVVETLSKWQTW